MAGPSSEPEAAARKFKFPTAFTVLAGVLVLVWIASFFVPAVIYKTDAAGAPVPGTYDKLPHCAASTPWTPLLPFSADTARPRRYRGPGDCRPGAGPRTRRRPLHDLSRGQGRMTKGAHE